MMDNLGSYGDEVFVFFGDDNYLCHIHFCNKFYNGIILKLLTLGTSCVCKNTPTYLKFSLLWSKYPGFLSGIGMIGNLL